MTCAITAPRRARRKPFGPSGWPARRVAAALVLGLVALGVPAVLGRLFKLRITLTDSAASAGIYRLATDFRQGAAIWLRLVFRPRSRGRARARLSPAGRLSGGSRAGREGYRRAAGDVADGRARPGCG